MLRVYWAMTWSELVPVKLRAFIPTDTWYFPSRIRASVFITIKRSETSETRIRFYTVKTSVDSLLLSFLTALKNTHLHFNGFVKYLFKEKEFVSRHVMSIHNASVVAPSQLPCWRSWRDVSLWKVWKPSPGPKAQRAAPQPSRLRRSCCCSRMSPLTCLSPGCAFPSPSLVRAASKPTTLLLNSITRRGF